MTFTLDPPGDRREPSNVTVIYGGDRGGGKSFFQQVRVEITAIRAKQGKKEPPEVTE